jgi:hypothetical protein
MSKKEELIDLLTEIKELVDEIESEAKGLVIASKLRITRRDLENIFADYADIVHDGNHRMIEKLIYDVTGEVTLFDAPIDLWPKLVEVAQDAIDDKIWEKYMEELSE